MPSDKAGEYTTKWSWTAGALVRREITLALKRMAWEEDVDLQIMEDRRWLQSRFFCTVKGTKDNLKRFFVRVDKLEKEAW